MAGRKQEELKKLQHVEEIDWAIGKLQRRIRDVERLDLAKAIKDNTGEEEIVINNVRDSIGEIFGRHSSEFKQYASLEIWSGDLYVGMSDAEFLDRKERGRKRVLAILNGLMDKLREKRDDLESPISRKPTAYFDRLNLHPRILDVSRDLFFDGYHWEAVFSAAKALINYVKERSSRHDLDGAPLVRTVFSRNDPILIFNDLKDQTDLDEQEGMMHLFEGAVLGIRNPGGHSFPEGTEQRAIEYLSLLSLLAYRVQEAHHRKP